MFCPLRYPGLAASLLSALLVLTAGAASTWAATIEGEQPEALAGEDSRIQLEDLPTGAAGDATIIHFSVLPTEAGGENETRIFVQRKGGRDVCVTIRSEDLISRSYRKKDEEPFSPSVPSTIQGDTSGQRGQLVGFNETKVFIEPDSPDNDFKLNECFTAGNAEGCFIDDVDECDMHLDEYEEVCVGNAVSEGACTGADHAGAIDLLKKMLAVNEQETLVTGAGPVTGPGDVVETPEIGGLFQPPGEGGGRPLVTGPTVTGPLGHTLVPGGGSTDLTIVPNLIGMTESQARNALESAMLQIGNISFASIESGTSVAGLLLIRPAHAQQQNCDFQVNNNEVCSQSERAGAIVPVGLAVSVILQTGSNVPEPATLFLFVTGLLLVIFLFHRTRNAVRTP